MYFQGGHAHFVIVLLLNPICHTCFLILTFNNVTLNKNCPKITFIYIFFKLSLEHITLQIVNLEFTLNMSIPKQTTCFDHFVFWYLHGWLNYKMSLTFYQISSISWRFLCSNFRANFSHSLGTGYRWYAKIDNDT